MIQQSLKMKKVGDFQRNTLSQLRLLMNTFISENRMFRDDNIRQKQEEFNSRYSFDFTSNDKFKILWLE